jgi:hypothetical protein
MNSSTITVTGLHREPCRHAGGDGLCSYCHHKFLLEIRRLEAQGGKMPARRSEKKQRNETVPAGRRRLMKRLYSE